MSANEKTVAVITGADHPTGLGTARALRKLEIETIGLYTKQNSHFCRSRVWDRLIPVSTAERAFLNEMIKIGRSLSPNRVVLFPTQDTAVKLISDFRDDLRRYFHFVLPSRSTVDLLMDKVEFHRWAKKHGFPVPDSSIATSPRELDSILDQAKYPVILKPVVRTSMWDSLSPRDKAFKLARKEDIEKIRFDIFQASPQFLVQRWIPGGDSNLHFCLTYINRQGNELGYYTGHKLVQWPIDCGSTAICVGTEDQELRRLTQAVFRAAEFIGLGSLEVKKSDKDNTYYIMEPTVGRNDLQSYVAVAAGVNLTAMAFDEAVGQRPHPIAAPRRNAAWVEEYSTLQLLLQPNGTNRLYREVLKALRQHLSFAYFEMRDPLPFIHLCKHMCKKAIVRRVKHYLGKT